MTYQIIITEESAANITIDNNTTNVSITTNEYPITIEYNATQLASSYGNANVAANLAAFANNPISTSGNITAGYFFGNGSQLTGLGATYGNANVAANLAAFANNPISTSGNITAGNLRTGGVVSATGNITGNYFLGNGSQLTGLPATYGNANVAANLAAFGSNPISTSGNITAGTVSTPTVFSQGMVTQGYDFVQMQYSNAVSLPVSPYDIGVGSWFYLDGSGAAFESNTTGTVKSIALNNDGSVSATGNITGSYFLGNGSQLTGLPVQPGTYGNANVAANLAAFANNPISTSGNITSGNLNVGIDAVITGNLTVNGTTTTVNSNTVTINDKFINVANNASTAALANGGGLGVGPVGTEYARLEYNSTANIWTTNIGVSVTGNVTGSVFTGNGSGLTALTGANVTGVVANATYALNANAASYSTNAVQAATANVANSVAGANVSGTVANATYALTSNAATYATQATFADTANAVAGANVSGTVANATYALNANASTFAGTVTTAAQPNITSVGILTAMNTSGNISATGNITAGYFLGNGSQLTGVTATDAIHATTLRIPVKNTSGGTLAQNTPVYATGSVGATETLEVSASRADTAATMPCFGLLETSLGVNAFGYAVAIGALSSTDTSTYTIGQTLYVAPTGGLTQSRPTNANAVQSVGAAGRINASTGQIEVNIWNQEGLPNLGSGNVWIGNAAAYPTQTVLATYSGNIGAGYFSGNGSLLTSLTGANVTGTVANATYALNSNAATYASVATFANTANAVAGANVTGTVANATFATSAGSATTATTANTVTDAAQANITSVGTLTGLSVSGNVNAGNLRTAGLITATGNITGGNVITGNLVITPNVGQIGNVVINSLPYTVQSNNSNSIPNQGRIVVGNGWDGNYSALYDPGNRIRTARFAVWDKVDRTDTGGAGTTTLATNVMQQRFMNGNVTNGATRNFAVVNSLVVGGGPLGNVSTATSPAAFVGMNGTMVVGNVTPPTGIGASSLADVGNTTMAAATSALFLTQIQPYSTVTCSYGTVSGTSPFGSESRVANVINYSNWNVNSGTGTANITPTNLFVSYYHANANGLTGGGAATVSTLDQYRAAPNYYAFYNADNVAQMQLGSLRAYHQFQYPAATSGTVNIDKNNSQVHFIAPTANVTIGDFQNFVTTASNSVSNLNQADTVTLVIQQGATPYTVTMPTGNASIKYAGGVSTIGTTANAVTMVSISAIRSAANATLYLASVSSEFS